MIPVFDLHCDTLTEMYEKSLPFDFSGLNVSAEKLSHFSPYIQVCAIWSNASLSDNDAFLRYKEVVKYKNLQNMYFCRSASSMRDKSFILAVEDARILSGDISRLDVLKSDGVKILTLTWRDVSCIGGAWNTSYGLTDFGVQTVIKCFEHGIIPDISHASEKSAFQVFELAEKYGKAILATHSNSYAVCRHKRNLCDEAFLRIKSLDGRVGISLAPEHLSDSGKADFSDILKHIEHYLRLGGEDIVALGCDFDGVSSLPCGISGIADLEKLYLALCNSFGTRCAKKIFFGNAYRFACKNLK